MPERVPVTVILQSRREKALIEEVAHRLNESRSSFCREAILRAVLDYTDEIENGEPENREEGK